MAAGDRTAFWIFSVAVYDRPGVREACLRLQDEAGLDVNVLLYCLWRAAHGADLETAELSARLAALEPWMAVAVRPLRSLRRSLKAAAPALPSDAMRLASDLSALELEAERTAQGLILSAVPEPQGVASGPAPERAHAHLSLYAGLVGARPAASDLALLVANL